MPVAIVDTGIRQQNENQAHPAGSQDQVVYCLNCNQGIVIQPAPQHCVCGRCGWKFKIVRT